MSIALAGFLITLPITPVLQTAVHEGSHAAVAGSATRSVSLLPSYTAVAGQPSRAALLAPSAVSAALVLTLPLLASRAPDAVRGALHAWQVAAAIDFSYNAAAVFTGRQDADTVRGTAGMPGAVVWGISAALITGVVAYTIDSVCRGLD